MAEEPKFGRMLLFAGAGASVGLGMPTMRSFVQRLSEADEPLRGIAARLLDRVQTADAEYLYDRLQLYAEVAELGGDDPIFEHLLGGSRRDLDTFRAQAHRALAQLQSLMLRCWGTANRAGDARYHYSSFYDQLCALNGAPLRVFTTNYDLAFESLYGFGLFDHTLVNGLAPDMESHDMVWDPLNYELVFVGDDEYDARIRKQRLFVYRLHGCSRWFGDEDGTVVYQARPTILDDTLAPIVVFPARRKDSRAFFRVYNHAYKAMQKAITEVDVCLVIGYSFRDQTISSIFPDAEYGTDFIVVDPEPDMHILYEVFDYHEFTHLSLAFGPPESNEGILQKCREALEQGNPYRSARSG